MRVMLTVEMPPEPFNQLVRDGKAGTVLKRIQDSIRPEAAYFCEQDGVRCGIYVINIQDASEIPRYAEPFFLNFQASCKFRIVMSAEDLQKANLEDLGRKWG